MKKYLVAVLMSVTLLSGCSYLSKMNPWSEAKEEPKVEVQQVNNFLWQAAMDKVSFMPVEQSDAKSGVIITSWTGLDGYPNQKFKLEIKIVSTELRSDCLKVSGFTRTRDGTNWMETPMNETMISAIEQSILERSRVLYRRSLAH